MIICVIPRGLQGKGGIERLFLQIGELKVLPSMRFITSRGDRSKTWSIGVFALSILRLATMLAFKPDAIVHINMSVQGSAYRKAILSWLAKAFGASVVVHFHGGGFDGLAHESWHWVKLAHKVIRSADAVIALGESWRDLFIKYGTAPERIHVIYNGVPDFGAGRRIPDQITNETPVRILFAGEVGPRKGADILVDALCRLRGEANWTCTIAGNGQIKEYTALLNCAGLGEHVNFPGWVDPQTVHKLMLQADVVVLPSRAEALPMSLIEGAAAGAALIATDVGAVREIVDDTCGIVIPCEAEALANALQKLIGDRALLRSLQKGARRRYLERFTLDHMIAGLLRVYHSVSKQYKGTSNCPYGLPERISEGIEEGGVRT